MSTVEHPDDVELRLLRLSALRCALWATALLALQLPMWLADGHDVLTSETSSDLRLALLLDLAFSVALLFAAFRLLEVLRVPTDRKAAAEFNAPTTDDERALLEAATTATERQEAEDAIARARRKVVDARLAVWLKPAQRTTAVATLAALANLAKDGYLWFRFAPDESALDGWLTLLPPLVSLVALVIPVMVLVRVYGRGKDDGLGDPMRQAVQSKAVPLEKAETIIACSGGGIRSASFSLGALQALMKAEVYRNSSAVIGVSGGGYMAAAFHYVGRKLDPKDDPPFEQGTPELSLLRRQTRYLLPQGTEIFRGLLSVVYGVLINVVMIAFALRAISWILGWYLDHFHVLTIGTDRGLVVDLDPEWVFLALLPWAFAAVIFLLVEKLFEHFVQVPDDARRGARQLIGWALGAGAVTSVLMLGVPLAARLLAWIARGNQTVPEPLVIALDPKQWGAASIATVITALIALGRTVWTGLGKAGTQSGLVGRIVHQLRVTAAPWLGTAIIIVVSFVVLTRWTVGYATQDGWRDDWSIVVVFGLGALGVRIFTDANRTSLHHFYRERLATAYLLQRKRSTADVEDYRRPMRVSRFAGPNGTGGPELVMCAVANVSDQQYVPTGRGCVPFIISSGETGVVGDPSLPPHGTKPTRAYEDSADYSGRDLTVPAAMAISGAAFSPLTGRSNARTRPIRVLLTVLNARLGVWLPNPYLSPPAQIARARRDSDSYKKALTKARTEAKEQAMARGMDEQTARELARKTAKVTDPEAPTKGHVFRREATAYLISLAGKPGPYRLLREAFGSPSLYDRKLYITDGGHYDNLGLLEALRRRPKRIVVIDASADAENSFGTLADAVATARIDLGVEVTFNTEAMKSKDGERAERAWEVGSASYPDGSPPAAIFVLKALLIDNLSTDVENYKLKNPDFPLRSTGDQLYDEWDFEAYRYLGNTLATKMLGGTTLKEDVAADVAAREAREERKARKRARSAVVASEPAAPKPQPRSEAVLGTTNGVPD